MQINKFDGSIITKPGVYSDIPIETYHNNPFLFDGPSTSSSSIKLLIDRPSLYWDKCAYNCNAAEREDKDHYTFGQAAHHLVLGEEDFQKSFVIRPERYTDDGIVELDRVKGKWVWDEKAGKKWSNNSLVCKEWNALQKSKGLQILKVEDTIAIEEITKKLLTTPQVMNGVLDGEIEHSMFHKYNDIWVRSRPDVIPIHDGDYADTKFVAEIDRHKIERNIFNFGWHYQAAICRKVSRSLFGKDFPFKYFLIFIEKTRPYDIYFHELDDNALDQGEEVLNTALDYMRFCIDRWVWPGKDGIDPPTTKISVPAFARAQTDQIISHMKTEMNSFEGKIS